MNEAERKLDEIKIEAECLVGVIDSPTITRFAKKILNIIDPPKPTGWIDENNLPPIGTVFTFADCIVRTLVDIQYNRMVFSCLGPLKKIYATTLTIEQWNKDHANNVIEIIEPENKKPEIIISINTDSDNIFSTIKINGVLITTGIYSNVQNLVKRLKLALDQDDIEVIME